MTNPAEDSGEPYFELVEDQRHRWSWVLWNHENEPLALSAISYENKRAAAENLLLVRSLAGSRVIYYTGRKRNRSGRYTQKHIEDLRSHD